MKTSIVGYLKAIAKIYGVQLAEKTPPDCFRELIYSLYEKTGERVVILIDEYDKPVTSHLYSEYLADIRIAVHDFYQVMKGADDGIRFVFLTGVSKFSGLSVFSALNNITDITIDKRYAAVCGYTQEELERNFTEYIDEAAASFDRSREWILEKIRHWYDGYTWDGKTLMYNPYSTLNFFDKKTFDGYWFDTGTPTFLLEIVKRQQKPEILTEPFISYGEIFKGYDPPNLSVVPLLFQSGYLTIKKIERQDVSTQYMLGIPNMEVNDALLKDLLKVYGSYAEDEIEILRRKILRQIDERDSEGLRGSLHELLFSVPFQLQKGNEADWHAIFLTNMRLLGFQKLQAEVSVAGGSIDLLQTQPDGTVIIMEIKYHAGKKVESLLKAAFKQIYDKRYYNPYINTRVVLLGIAFTGKDVGCRFEELKIKN
jgi:hypothetical protein